MNNQRRKELNRIATELSTISITSIDMLEFIQSNIEMILINEEIAFENMPENFQYCIRGEASQEAQNNINKAIDLIDEFLSNIEDREDEEDDNDEIIDLLENMINDVVELLEAAAY